MRRFTRLLIASLASLLLVAPMGVAHAAKANPWSAYFPAKGVTCTSTITQANGTTETRQRTVVAKSAKKVVTRVSGAGRTTSLLLSSGRLRQTASMTGRQSGIRVRATVTANYPSPAKLLHHRPGNGVMSMTMTMPARAAKATLKHGRTLTITGTYRIAGIGTRSITLADPAATVVEAIGIRTTLRSMRIANAKPAFARAIKKEMRSLFASLGDTEWVAQHRGTVRVDSVLADGSTLTETQVGCR